MSKNGTIHILPIELLYEVLEKLPIRDAVRFAVISGDVVMRSKIKSIGGIKDVVFDYLAKPSDISLAVRFTGMTSLILHLGPRYRLDLDIGWVASLPPTLKSLDFNFSLSDYIWLRFLRPNDAQLPYRCLYEMEGYIPISLRTQFPHLKSFVMRGTPSTEISLLRSDYAVRVDSTRASRSCTISWNHYMIHYFMVNLPDGLETLKTVFLQNIGFSPIMLPKSLTRIYASSETLEKKSRTTHLGQDIGESLVQLSWSAWKESISEISSFAPHLRALSVFSRGMLPLRPLRSQSMIGGARLRALTVVESETISFPPTLRKLSMCSTILSWRTDEDAIEFFRVLPSQLNTLKTRHGTDFLISPSAIASLPSQLTTLKIKGKVHCSSLSGLPKSLTSLTIQINGLQSNLLNLSDLPPRLTRLGLKTSLTWLPSYCEQLPRTLLYLDLECSHTEPDENMIAALPRSLVWLRLLLDINWTSSALSMLPEYLSVLKLPTSAQLREEDLPLLPSTLVELCGPCISCTGTLLKSSLDLQIMANPAGERWASRKHLDSELLLQHLKALLPRGVAVRQPLHWKSNSWGWTAPNMLDVMIAKTFELPGRLTSLDLSDIPLAATQESDILQRLPCSVTHLTLNTQMCSAEILERVRTLSLPSPYAMPVFYQIFATATPKFLTKLQLPHAQWLSFLELPKSLEYFEVDHIESHLLTGLHALHTLIQGRAQHGTTQMRDLPHSLTHLTISFSHFLMAPSASISPNPLTLSSSSASSQSSATSGAFKLPRGERLLPPKLVFLSLNKTTVSRALFDALPPSVTHVHAEHLYINQVRELFQCMEEADELEPEKANYQTFDLSKPTHLLPAKFLEPYHGHFDCTSYKLGVTEEDLFHLPKRLTTFVFPNTGIECSLALLRALPSQLTCLDLREVQNSLRHTVPAALPKSLTILYANASQWTSDSFLDLPRGLTQLFITAIKAFRRQHAQKMPSQIHTLSINCRRIYDPALAYLPTSLTQLTLKDAHSITIKGIRNLPRSLRSLSLDELPSPSQGLIDALPPSLTQLRPYFTTNADPTIQDEQNNFWRFILQERAENVSLL